MPDYQIFDLGDTPLQCGVTLLGAKLAYKTYGQLNAARDNVIVMPTFFGGQHTETEAMIGAGRPLDPERYFIVVPNMFGNGLSSSPSNAPPPLDRAAFPNVTVYDNVVCQHRLLTEHLEVQRIRLVVGFSMGAQQAFQWGALYSDMVEAIAPYCGTSRTSPHNHLLLEGAKAALVADSAFSGGWYETAPVRGLRAFSCIYDSWMFSHSFFRDREYLKLGFASVEDTVRFTEGYFRARDANDLLTMLWAWQHADISDNEQYGGELTAALGAIRSRAIVMPSESDLFFRVSDNEWEVQQMPNAELRPIPSTWGHIAGFGVNETDTRFIDAALEELLAA